MNQVIEAISSHCCLFPVLFSMAVLAILFWAVKPFVKNKKKMATIMIFIFSVSLWLSFYYKSFLTSWFN